VAVSRLILLYGMEGANVDAFVTYYYTVDASPDTVITMQALRESYLYCKGINSTTVASYALNAHTVTTDRETILKLAPCLTDALLAEWYALGIPSTAYITYTCYPALPETFTLNMASANAPQYTTNAVIKQGHRMRFKVSGSFTDSDVANEIRDFFYLHNTLTGVKTFEPTMFNIGHATTQDPTQAEVPFSPSHVYDITVDIPATAGSSTMTIIRDNGTSFVLPNVSGILSFELIDLGEYVV